MLKNPIYFLGCDISPAGHIRPAAFLRNMQSIACRDLDLQDLSQEMLHNRDLAFILSKTSLRITDPFLQGVDISLETNAREIRGASFIRDFYFYKADTLVGTATTRWALLNLKTRTLCRPRELPREIPHDPSRTPGFDCPRLLQVVPEHAQSLGTQTVTRSMTDANAHLNNVVYLDLCQNVLPDIPYLSLDIEYVRELSLNEEVELLRAPDDDGSMMIYGIRKRDSLLSFLAKLA